MLSSNWQMASTNRLLALAILLCLIPSANAADLACTASVPATPTVRGEGLTQFIGDIVIRCTGGNPTPSGQTIPAASITIVLNTTITSRLMGNSPVNSEALLLIDEPGSQLEPGTIGLQLGSQRLQRDGHVHIGGSRGSGAL